MFQDLKDPIELLAQKNINKKALLDYIKDACDYCTDYQLPELKFEMNHHDEPDVALFDFTSMFAASNSCYVKERHGKQLLCGLGMISLKKSLITIFGHKHKIKNSIRNFKFSLKNFNSLWILV